MINKISVCVMVFLFMGLPVWARVLTLDQCIELALQKNIDLTIAAEEIESSQAKINQAWSTVFPKFSFDADGSRSFSRQQTMALAAIFPTLANSDPTNTYRGSVSLNQLLFGLHVLPSLEAGDLAHAMAQKKYEQSRSELIFKTTEAFYNVLKAEKFLETAQEADRYIDRLIVQIQEVIQLGSATRSDFLRLNLQKKKMLQNVIQAQSAYQLSVLSLNSVLGIELDTQVQCQPSTVTEFSLDSIVEPDIFEMAAESRPEVILLNFQRQLLGKQQAVLWGSSMPMVFLNASYGVITDELRTPKWDEDEEWRITVAAKWAFFDGGEVGAQIKDTQAQMKMISLQEQNLQKGIRFEVQLAIQSLQLAVEKVEAGQSEVALAEEILKITEEKFLNGVDTNLQLIDSQNSLMIAQNNYYSALYDLEISKARLTKVIGAQK